MKRVLIIGGYGNFGTFITRTLAQDVNIRVVIAGRSLDKARTLAASLKAVNSPECVVLDIGAEFSTHLQKIAPDIVIHTSGPFQGQSYNVAEACIAQRCHYIDLADGRDFVKNFSKLDIAAKANGVLAITGASSVPCLTSALVDYYKDQFQTLERIDYGITTAQKTSRGLATIASILSYTGQAFQTRIDGIMRDVYGWQSLHVRNYPNLGPRLLGNCNVPDLELFPTRYPDIKTIRFYAGLEIPLVHLTLWLLSWLVRFKVIRHLEKTSPFLLRASYLFDWLGTPNSAFHMDLSGTGKDGVSKTIRFDLTARSGDGPYIPCMPSILLTKKLVYSSLNARGAYPCMGFISKDEYLEALSALNITWQTRQ